MARSSRYTAIAAAAVLLVEPALEVVGPGGDTARGAVSGLLIMICLTTIGTLLGRLPQGFNVALTAGVFGGFSALGRLASHSSWIDLVFDGLCLAAALVLIVVSLVVQRRLKDQPVEPPPYV